MRSREVRIDVGCVHASVYKSVFRPGAGISCRMQAVEVKAMTLETAVVLGLSVLLMVYLVYALLRPEKF